MVRDRHCWSKRDDVSRHWARPSTTYFFRVRASNTGGDSGYSNEASVTTSAGVPNLVGQWLFDEIAGNTAVNDTSFTGNHGTLVGGTTRVIGTNGAQAGNSLTFDGVNDHVLNSQNLAGVLGGTATLVTWIRTSALGNNTFWQAPGITGVEESGFGNDIFWGWIDATGRIGMSAGNGAAAKSTNPINDNAWHHVALTRNATTGLVQVYVDGVLSGTATSEIGVKTTPFSSIGRIEDTAGTPTYLNGQLDELQVFNRVLSQSEIQALRHTNVVLQTTTGDDAITINRSTGNGYIRIYLNQPLTGTPWYAIQPDLLGSMQIDGLAGNDILSVAINATAGYPIRAGGLTFNGGDGNDSLNIQGDATSGTIPHTFAGGAGLNTLNVNAGLISIDSTATGGVLNTTVATGAQMTTSRFRQNGLTINGTGLVTILPGGGQVNTLTSLTVGDTAKLDIKDNALVVDYTGVSPAAAIRQRILSGRGGAGLGKTWNGPGITSSTVAAVNATQPESRSIGYVENSALPLGPYTEFRGQPVDTTTVIIAYTRTGDATLDGIVNNDDVTVVGASFAPSSGNGVWGTGDFEYNNSIDSDDVTLLGVFYNPTAPLPPPPATAVSTKDEGRRTKGATAGSSSSADIVVDSSPWAALLLWQHLLLLQGRLLWQGLPTLPRRRPKVSLRRRLPLPARPAVMMRMRSSPCLQTQSPAPTPSVIGGSLQLEPPPPTPCLLRGKITPCYPRVALTSAALVSGTQNQSRHPLTNRVCQCHPILPCSRAASLPLNFATRRSASAFSHASRFAAVKSSAMYAGRSSATIRTSLSIAWSLVQVARLSRTAYSVSSITPASRTASFSFTNLRPTTAIRRTGSGSNRFGPSRRATS